MILVDTSAWIDFFRARSPVAEVVENLLEENEVALCGPVHTELLRGLKSKAERRLVASLLSGCHHLPQPDNLWEDAGNCGFVLGRKGRNVKTLDLLIACYAMAHKIPLLTLDRDFTEIKKAGFDLQVLDDRS